MNKIVECVPNFSEGRDDQILNKIAKAITSFPQSKILDIHKDPDHNRSVFTYIGDMDSAPLSAFEAIKTAAGLIDLTKHQGVHPRIGATDVFPFIPIKNIDENRLIEITRELADKVADELNIPTYVYEKSALKQARSNLSDIRKGIFEPDYPVTPEKYDPKTGATVIGVRDILIAYNINLKSRDIDLAKKIANQIREKGGGLISVKALGLFLKEKNLVQVSMNLTNYHKNSIPEVYEAVKKLSHENDTDILESEVIGLLPKDALRGNSPETFKIRSIRFLDDFI